jgi:hypothetical protein
MGGALQGSGIRFGFRSPRFLEASMDSTSDSRFAPRGPEDAGDRYRDLRTVAEDGAARYLVGEDVATGERVAMIVARPVAVLTSASSTAHAEARLARAREAAELGIDGIAPVRTLGRTAGGHPFVVSQLQDGLLHSRVTADEPLTVDRALRHARSAATVLATAHSAGIVHGSVSPHTIIVQDRGASASLHGFGISSPWVPTDERERRVGVGGPPSTPDDADDAWLDVMAREDIRALARVVRAHIDDAPARDGEAPAVIAPALLALLARAETDPGMSAEEFAAGLRQVELSGTPWPDPDGEYGPIAAPPSRRRERRVAGVLMAIAALLALFVVLGRADRATEPTLEDRLAEANAPATDGRGAPDAEADREPSGDVVANTPPAGQGASRRTDADSRVPQTPRSREESYGAVAATPRRSGGSNSAEGAPARAERRPAATPRTDATQGTDASRLTTVPSGTNITLAAGERVCTDTHAPGDVFPATVLEAAGAGAIIPAGSRAEVQISSVERAKAGGEPARLGLAVQQLIVDGRRYPVDASITRVQVDQTRASSSDADAQKVIGGAIAGAILGQVLGKDTRSTVIGAATGAAAGTVIAMQTGGRDGCIPAGGTIAIRLDAPAQVARR